MRTANEEAEAAPVKVYYTRGDKEQNLSPAAQDCTPRERQSPLLLSPAGHWTVFPFLLTLSLFLLFPPSLPGSLNVHIRHLLWAPLMKFYAYKYLSTSFKPQHSQWSKSTGTSTVAFQCTASSQHIRTHRICHGNEP